MMALANTYGLLFIILLLGQGLIQVPRQLWETSFNEKQLQRLYFKATQVRTGRRCMALHRVTPRYEARTIVLPKENMFSGGIVWTRNVRMAVPNAASPDCGRAAQNDSAGCRNTVESLSRRCWFSGGAPIFGDACRVSTEWCCLSMRRAILAMQAGVSMFRLHMFETRSAFPSLPVAGNSSTIFVGSISK